MNFSKFRRRMSTVVTAGFLAGTVMFGASQAQATLYEWTISDIFFDERDGGGGSGAVAGTFLFNTVGNVFSDINLVLSGSGVFTPSITFSESLGSSNSGLLDASPSSSNDILSLGILPSFAIVASGFGPPVIDFTVGLTRCFNASCTEFAFFEGLDPNLSSVEITPSAVPVPAALPLFGTGLAIMGFLGWRRKSKAVAV